jgi:hypothetical protein
VAVAGRDLDRRPTRATVAKDVCAALAGGAASVGAALLAQLSAIEFSIAGAAGVLLTFAIRFRAADPGGGHPRSSPGSQPFETMRDVDVSDRNDAGTFPEYRRIVAESHRQWAAGALVTDADRTTAKNNALNFILNAEARRASHAEKGPVTLVVVKESRSNFIVKRVAPPSFGNGIREGMECHHDLSLAALADRYASFHYDAEFKACGETYHLVALGDTPLSPTAIGIVEDAATHYQLAYTYFRMVGVAEYRLLPPAPADEG